MNKNDSKAAFPGFKSGMIRVFIKRTAQQESAQLHFHFSDKELPQQN